MYQALLQDEIFIIVLFPILLRCLALINEEIVLFTSRVTVVFFFFNLRFSQLFNVSALISLCQFLVGDTLMNLIFASPSLILMEENRGVIKSRLRRGELCMVTQ